MKQRAPRRIAVTGASGFIGRHVLSELLKRSRDVVALVRNNENHQFAPFGIELFPCDIHNPPDNTFEMLGRPDVLIHLAWGGLPNYHSMHHLEQELPGQYNFLKSLVRDGLSALVVSGSCFEYGMQSGQLSEEMKLTPHTTYGHAKNNLCQQLEQLKTKQPFLFTWARLFYLFGEGQGPGSLFSQLKLSVAQDNKSFNMSGGEQVRDYLHVSEAAKLIVMLALNRADLGAVNVCSGQPISVRNLVEGWIRENGWNIALNLGYFEYPEYESMAFWGSRRRLDLFLNSIKEKEWL